MNDVKHEIENTIWYQHEGLDRSHTILVMIQELLGYNDEDCSENVHPSVWNDKCKELLSQATLAMADLYQEIGQWEEPNEN